MLKRIISTDAAPAAIGPYSQAVRHGPTLFASGQLGINPATGELAEGVEEQARQAFRNVAAIAAAAETTLASTLKITLFLTDMNDFAVVNRVMTEVMSEPYPARSCVAVAALPKGGLVEVEAVIALPFADI